MSVDAPYEKVIAALKARGSHRNGHDWQCPAHDDRTPSMTVKKARNGIPLIHCHAGCSTTTKILPELGLEPSDLFPDQPRLFPVERFSPVRRSGWLALPASSARDFGVATTFGRILAPDRTFRRVASYRDTIAIVLETKHRKALRQELAMSSPRLSNLITEWTTCSMAHRCNRQELTLFVVPDVACPYCGSSLLGELGAEKSSLLGEQLPAEVHPPVNFSGTNLHQPKAGSTKELVAAHSWSVYPELKALEYLVTDLERRAPHA
jgi:hypothetical protein